ncbi:SulP family inorganic anion transporter [Corynebacterium caspium]|uniref:SulP family inorganic anion transporter n=1 Tax=Corynebacterium caspium TaxID=234828 RepID=UPI000370CF47|nr:SulP family inorganic anion transporter [Corynebacterium caspium]WKD58492.1 Bicarbonate transporter BicA [Corynebacterium caspium DSM 44850]
MTLRTDEATLGVVESFRLSISSLARFKTEVLAGLVVAFALIPEALSFSILAGVDPRVGLFASAAIAITIAFSGGRPAMMSGAAGSVALVIAPVVSKYGMDYLLATVLLGGIMQIIMGAVGIARLMRFIPRSVMIGFINALAILIFMAQVPHLIGVPIVVYPLVIVGILIVWLLPRVFTLVPAALVAILVLTIATVLLKWQVPTVSDMGQLPTSWPTLLTPDVPFNFETLRIIFPYALAMSLVAIMESLLTAKLVDDRTQTTSNKTRETWGQGVANLAAGLFGGIGGCAMIGQTVVGVDAGARTRLSTLCSGIFLLVLVVSLGELTGMIPIAALVAVMLMVVVSTADWHSIKPKTLKLMPVSETVIMLTTVILTVITSNLAIGVIGGVIMATIIFTNNASELLTLKRVELPEGGTVYTIKGQLFFASSNELVYQFWYIEDKGPISIDLSEAQILDASAVSALDSIMTKYQEVNKKVSIMGLPDGPSKDRLEKLIDLV